LEQLYYNVRIRWFFAISLDYTTRIAGGFLFRTLRELNWLKPLLKNGLPTRANRFFFYAI
uniref:hypothetical protein n=1 Tax=Paenibacillus caui TaxID=2873927 RepID=UPI001CA8F77C